MEQNDQQTEVATDFPIGTLLRFLYSSVAKEEERHMVAAGYGNIHIAHFPVLKQLHTSPEGVRITDLAAWAHITKPSMVYLVNYLVERGYVERNPNSSDKRAQMVQLTPRGREAAGVFSALNLNIEQRWQQQFGSQAVSQWKHLLQSLVLFNANEQWTPLKGEDLVRVPSETALKHAAQNSLSGASRRHMADQLVAWMNAISTFFRRKMQHEALTQSQANLLGMLIDGQRWRINDLAYAEGVRPASMTELVTRMSHRGWITKSAQVDGDNRGVEVTITAEGLTRITRFIEQEQTFIDQKLAALSEDERTAIEQALPALNKLLQQLY